MFLALGVRGHGHRGWSTMFQASLHCTERPCLRKKKQNPSHNKSKSFSRHTQTTAPSHTPTARGCPASRSATSPEQDHLSLAHWETPPQPLLTAGGLLLLQPTVTLTLGPETSHVSTGAGQFNSKPTSNPCIRK